MFRLAGFELILGLVLILTVCAGDPERAPLPRDTLPPHLSLDAIPKGLDARRPVPDDNPLTDAKVQLGRKLFFDPILSGDGTISCASCHDPSHGFAGKEPRALGIGGKRGRRNAPTIFNRAYGDSFFWDGRTTTLEEQALGPIADANELGSSVADAVKRLQDDTAYRTLFEAAFPDGVTPANLGKAIASFERTLLSGNSPADRFPLGDVGALDAAERHGKWLFDSRGSCWRCHSGPNFTDEQFHNTGVSWGKQPLDLGRYEVTKREADRGRFKTPTLRNVAQTHPYMHDGSLATLEDVVEFYNKGGGPNPHLNPIIKPLGLSPEEAKALVAFLKALSNTPVGKPEDTSR